MNEREIGYEALANIISRGVARDDLSLDIATSVIVALRGQGLCVVRADDLQFILDEFVPDDVIKDRLLAILTAHKAGNQLVEGKDGHSATAGLAT